MILDWGTAAPAAAFASGIIVMDFGASGEGVDPGPSPSDSGLPRPVFGVARSVLSDAPYMHGDDRPDSQNRR